jgi:hypothetical protein
VRSAQATQKNAVMDLEAVRGTPRVLAPAVEPPQELRYIALMPEQQRSDTSHADASSSKESDNSDDTFNTARSEVDSVSFPELDPKYHPSNDLVDFPLDALHGSVRDSHASDSTVDSTGTCTTITTITTIEVGEAVPVCMILHSPTLLSLRRGSVG